MDATDIRYESRVLIARRPLIPGSWPLTGVAVARWFQPDGQPVYSIVLDAPTEGGRAVVDCVEAQLVLLAPASKVCNER
jgi:hypothetical protein